MISLEFIVSVDESSLYVPEKVLVAAKSAILIKLTCRFPAALLTKTIYIKPLFAEVDPYIRKDV